MKKNILTTAFSLSFFLVFGQETINKTVYFDYAKSNLKEISKKELDNQWSNIDKEKIQKIKIIGHRDGDGSYIYNTKLSRQRTSVISDYFESKGVSVDKIVQQYHGEEQPIASNETDGGKQQNRRVEIKIEFENFAVPSSFLVPEKIFSINPKKDTILQLNSKGTKLHVPKYAFKDSKGKVINSTVDLHYKEYTNSAEIAFSEIPMTYKSPDQEFFFNSSGMFELTGSSRNSPVEINKKLQIDYALAKKNPETNFYQLNSSKENWQKIQDIQPIARTQKQERINDESEIVLVAEFADTIFMGAPRKVHFAREAFNPQNMKISDGTLLAAGADKGHTYPDIVVGLNIPSFGVYNCDQIYRVPNVVSIQADFIDEKGDVIKNGHVLSMITLDKNGAFSFDPSHFMCNPKGQNVLALFTESKDLYILSKEDFAKMNIEKGGKYTFQMTNMTGVIKDTKDLAKYLNVKM